MLYQVLDQRPRNPQTLQSSSFAVPAVLSNKHIQLRVLLSASDCVDPTLVIRIAVQGSWDVAGTNWTDIAGGVWTGGYDSEGLPRTPPSLGWISANIPLFIRGEIDWNKRVNIGLELEAS